MDLQPVYNGVLEIGVLLLGTAVTTFVVPWLRSKRLLADQQEADVFAQRVDDTLSKVLASAIVMTPGAKVNEEIVHSLAPEVISNAKKIMAMSAPEMLKRIGDTFEIKALRFLPLADTALIDAPDMIDRAKALAEVPLPPGAPFDGKNPQDISQLEPKLL